MKRRLTEMLLQDFPELRQDKGMMKAYMFLLDFLEAVGKETNTRIKENQKLLKGLMEASKISETVLDDYIASWVEQVRNVFPSGTPAVLTVTCDL